MSEQDCKAAVIGENRTGLPGVAANDGYLLDSVPGEPAESTVCHLGRVIPRHADRPCDAKLERCVPS
jgi:hypothetical protein